jgi:hypothetical protein
MPGHIDYNRRRRGSDAEKTAEDRDQTGSSDTNTYRDQKSSGIPA